MSLKSSEILDEEKYLNDVLNAINDLRNKEIDELRIIKEKQKEFSLKFAEDAQMMDPAEMVFFKERLLSFSQQQEDAQNYIERLNRQEKSPYFGRIDFKDDDFGDLDKIYIGINNVFKYGTSVPYVCDWRAPISSLFYDYEIGKAQYSTKEGEINGEIFLKRQYKIQDKVLKEAFNSSVVIQDDILQQVLANNASSKMQSIISTIQREQNKIIRNEVSKNILVQGVAGSGKTSIALHRIAYLLYQHRDSLSPKEILILSPNKLFSKYISDVLPELGEENVEQVQFYDVANDELKFLKKQLQTREENIEEIFNNDQLMAYVNYCHSLDFYIKFKRECSNYFDNIFFAEDIDYGNVVVKAGDINKLYYTNYKEKPVHTRISWICDYITSLLNVKNENGRLAKKTKEKLYSFFAELDILKIYTDILANMNLTFSLTQNNKIRYCDISNILYIVNYLYGLNCFKNIKYLIVDEMQDYSYVQFDIFNNLFNCSKTILGDINQCIEKSLSYDSLEFLAKMLDADLVNMNKSYRSTYELTDYACSIKNISCDKVERHGEKPIKLTVNRNNFEETINDICTSNCQFNSIAILTKDSLEAQEIYKKLNSVLDISLNIDTECQIKKLCVMPAYLSKGLEFDMVIVPNTKKYNLSNVFDKNLYYIPVTRALHKLYLLSD